MSVLKILVFMNKITLLKFDSVCLIAVYPPTAILGHKYGICGEKCKYSARAPGPKDHL